MTDTEATQRAAVVAAARSWLTTPYHHSATIKGVGVDCATLIAETFREAGLANAPEAPEYSPQWHLHHSEERYLAEIMRHTREIEVPPLPGDIVLFQFGRCFSHAGIVIAWPRMIHAYIGKGCVIEDVEKAAWLTHIGENVSDKGKPRPRRYFSYWGRNGTALPVVYGENRIKPNLVAYGDFLADAHKPELT